MFITGHFYTGIYDNRPGHHFRSSGFHFSTVSALRCTECGGPTTDPVGNGGSALHTCVPHEKKSLNPQTQIHGFYMVLPLAMRSILAGLGRLCIGSHLAIVRNSLKSWVWPKPNSGNLKPWSHTISGGGDQHSGMRTCSMMDLQDIPQLEKCGKSMQPKQ